MKFSICIASYNQGHLISEAIESCLNQDYKDLEIIVYDDASTDRTEEIIGRFNLAPNIKYYKGTSPSGTGGAFNRAMTYATGEVIMLLCADDVLTNNKVVMDVSSIFRMIPTIGHVSRYYHQFIDGDRRPVRAWRGNDIIELANNPSGLAFRRQAFRSQLQKANTYQLSNLMFVEASTLVRDILQDGWSYTILKWDTVAVRIHSSISQNKNYYLKMWKSSPIEEWNKVGGAALLKDYTSLIQIKNNFTIKAVIIETWNFIKLRPLNLFNLGFWFYAIISIFTPRFILRRLPHLYRVTIGRLLTKEIKRP